MEKILTLAGRIVGAIGVLVCAIAVIARLLGGFKVAGLWAATLLQGAVAAVVIGCFLLLVSMSLRK